MQEEVKNYEVTEAIEVNFDGGLDDLKIDKNNTMRTIFIHKMKKEMIQKGNENMKIRSYNVFVRNDGVVLKLIDSWRKQGNFDDLAFNNVKSDEKQVKIREITKLG